jgi:hypothetical protein
MGHDLGSDLTTFASLSEAAHAIERTIRHLSVGTWNSDAETS